MKFRLKIWYALDEENSQLNNQWQWSRNNIKKVTFNDKMSIIVK